MCSSTRRQSVERRDARAKPSVSEFENEPNGTSKYVRVRVGSRKRAVDQRLREGSVVAPNRKLRDGSERGRAEGIESKRVAPCRHRAFGAAASHEHGSAFHVKCRILFRSREAPIDSRQGAFELALCPEGLGENGVRARSLRRRRDDRVHSLLRFVDLAEPHQQSAQCLYELVGPRRLGRSTFERAHRGEGQVRLG